jgi:hypothetical protein
MLYRLGRNKSYHIILYMLAHRDEPIQATRLTNSMVQGPCWEANRFSASREIPHILWKPRVHYHVYRCPVTCPYPKPAVSTPYPTSRTSILILFAHLRLGLPSGLLPTGFPTKTLHASPARPHMLRAGLCQSSRFYHPDNIWWAIHIIKFLIM